MGLFTTDEAIIAEGVKYLAVIRFTYLFFAVTTILLATLRSVEIVKIAFYLSVSTLVINCCINYVLIYGRFGAPQLGVIGAAIGTLAARIIECAVAVWYVLKKEPNLKMRISDYFHTDRILRKDYYKTTLPMLVVQGLWGLNTAMQTAILGHMTARAIASERCVFPSPVLPIMMMFGEENEKLFAYSIQWNRSFSIAGRTCSG